MPVKKLESRSQTSVIDEFNHGEKLINSIFKGGPGKHQGEGRFQGLDHTAGFGLPTLNPLPLIYDDQVPLNTLNREVVAQYLLVIADTKKIVAFILVRTLFGTAQYQTAAAIAEALDFNAAEIETEPLVVELDLFIQVNIPFSAFQNKLFTFSPNSLQA